MKAIKVLMISTILVIAMLSIVDAAEAAIFYVDFASGDDANNGSSPDQAWKRSPGDSEATGIAASTVLQPGDIVRFKGGIKYRGMIIIRSSGTEDNPIIFQGDTWPGLEGTKAIIDGSEPLPDNWQRCTSADDVNGNPNWENIYYQDYSEDISPFTVFFQDEQPLYLTQFPHISDPFWSDRYGEYLPVTHENITTTSIRDPSFFTLPDADSYDGAYVMIWVNPNIIATRAIASFDPGSHTIFFDEPLADVNLYPDGRNQYYSIVNHLSYLDRAGKVVIDEARQRFYLWPENQLNGSEISYGARADGIRTDGQSHLLIESFHIRRTYADRFAHAIWNYRTSGEPSRDITIRNNEITWIKTRDGRQGAIHISNVDGLLIENNHIHHCPRNSGILSGSTNVLVLSNIIHKVGYKGVWFMNVNHGQIIDNKFSECDGTHGNPISVFTTSKCLVARNVMSVASGEALTFEVNEDFVVHNNLVLASIVDGNDTGTFVLRENGNRGSGYHVITNNTILHSRTNFALGISDLPNDSDKLFIHNNIADGGGNFMDNVISHNIYTGLSWRQHQRYGWELSTGELVEENLNNIFINFLTGNYRLTSQSPARRAGIDIEQAIPTEVRALFPGFDWHLDLEGNRHGINNSWDIGAYAYPISSNDPNQSINLESGWNWVSFTVIPADLSIVNFFNPVLLLVEQVRAQNLSAIRTGNQFTGDLIDMDGIENGQMYKIRAGGNNILTIYGSPFPTNSSIPLTSGWNWVAYTPSEILTVNTALATISEQVLQIRSQTESAIFSNSTWVGDLTEMVPGQGYKIFVNEPAALTYPLP